MSLSAKVMNRGIQVGTVFITPLKAVVASLAVAALVYFYWVHLLPIWRELPSGVFRHQRLAVGGLIAAPVLWIASWYALLFQDDREGGIVQPSRRSFYVVMGCLGIAASSLIIYAVLASER